MGAWRRAKRFLIGSPLTNDMAMHERIPKWKALAVLSSDALSSVAYATEEILIPLSLFATAAVAWSIPIALGICLLLVIVTVSYRQTIDAYPGGGGAYTVARDNLGTTAGLVAGAALLIDYTLTVAVSVAAGVENIAAAFPDFAAHKVLLGSLVILIIMTFNLRGVRESASVFALPTYLFIFSFLILIVVGIYRMASGDVPPKAPLIHEIYPEVGLFLLMRAFASGCAALTGIEAISNGIPIFKEPAQNNAKTTMVWMSVILGVLFLSITLLAHIYGVIPKEGETAVSLLAQSVFGQNGFYYIIQGSTALILFLAANTSYADFPRLSSMLAKDRFLPRQLAILGDRLVFSNGIVGLSLVAISLLVLFKGSTHLLIPLYAVGVFLSFTLSQTGMIRHHFKFRQPGWRQAMAFNTVGAVTTFSVLVVITSTKFIHGAWVVVLLIPFFVFVFNQIRYHYVSIARKLSYVTAKGPIKIRDMHHIAIVPVSGIHPGVVEALQYALSITKDVRALSVDIDERATKELNSKWAQLVPDIPLTTLPSPFRSVITPVVEYISELEKNCKDQVITVIIPEFVTRKWYHQFLHNQTALLLRASLWLRHGRVVTSIRYYLD